MDSEISVSVVITTRNERSNIVNCLDSVKKQSYPQEKIEMIVVDNNSTDGTKDITLRYTDKIYNYGPERSAQRNEGVRRARGKYVLYLDADMILSADIISECVDKCESEGFVALYIPERIIGDGFWTKVRDFERNFYNATCIDCVRFVNRDKFLEIGGFDENLTGPEDWDFDRRIKESGRIGIIDSPVYHREGSFNFKKYLKKKLYYLGSFERYIQKWGKDDATVKRQLGAWYRYFGVFFENGKWKKILKHPLLTLGMYFLRIMVGAEYLKEGLGHRSTQEAEIMPGSESAGPLHILVMANSMVYPDLVSGGDKIFVEISKHLDFKRYRITVVTNDIGYKLWRETGPKGIKLIRIPKSIFDRLLFKAIVPLMYLMRAVYVCLMKVTLPSASVIYSSSDFICDTIPAAWLKIRRKDIIWISRIYHIIPPPARRQGNRIFNLLSFLGQRLSFRIIRQKANLIVALNGALYDELCELNFPRHKLAISGGGIDFGRIEAVSPAQNIRYDGIFLGRLHTNKGIFDLIEIWKSVVLLRRDARLAIIGGGDVEIIQAVNKRIDQYSLRQNIDLLGFIPDDSRVYGILKAGKLFLFTDHESGWSLATCEAMACGLPVVAYNLEIFGEVFKKGFVTVSLYDVERFSGAVVRLLNDKDERIKLAQEALQQAKTFDWKETAKSFLGQLERLRERFVFGKWTA